MSSKYRLDNSSIYIPGTSIPYNKLGIEDAETLHLLEGELLKEAYGIFYDELAEETKFDESYFQALHRRTFESLYDWAGRYRTFNMSKGESRFCQGMYVASESKRIFKELEAVDWLRGFSDRNSDEFAKTLAYFQGELIALHPFYELNGRILRLFFDMIALYNGYEAIDYGDPEEYIDASIASVQYADTEKLRQIIRRGLKR